MMVRNDREDSSIKAQRNGTGSSDFSKQEKHLTISVIQYNIRIMH